MIHVGSMFDENRLFAVSRFAGSAQHGHYHGRNTHRFLVFRVYRFPNSGSECILRPHVVVSGIGANNSTMLRCVDKISMEG